MSGKSDVPPWYVLAAFSVIITLIRLFCRCYCSNNFDTNHQLPTSSPSAVVPDYVSSTDEPTAIYVVQHGRLGLVFVAKYDDVSNVDAPIRRATDLPTALLLHNATPSFHADAETDQSPSSTLTIKNSPPFYDSLDFLPTYAQVVNQI